MPKDNNEPTTSTRRDGLGGTPVVVDINKGMGSTPVSSVVDPFAAAGVQPAETGGGTGSGSSERQTGTSGSSGSESADTE